MNIVVSDPKTRKAYSKKVDNAAMFNSKKVGEEVELGLVGLEGYAAKITGGSDKQGFAIKSDLAGTNRREIYIIKDAKSGKRMKVRRRGNVISDEISQLNLKVTKYGPKGLGELLGNQEKKEEGSLKDRMVKESLENV